PSPSGRDAHEPGAGREPDQPVVLDRQRRAQALTDRTLAGRLQAGTQDGPPPCAPRDGTQQWLNSRKPVGIVIAPVRTSRSPRPAPSNKAAIASGLNLAGKR